MFDQRRIRVGQYACILLGFFARSLRSQPANAAKLGYVRLMDACAQNDIVGGCGRNEIPVKENEAARKFTAYGFGRGVVRALWLQSSNLHATGMQKRRTIHNI